MRHALRTIAFSACVALHVRRRSNMSPMAHPIAAMQATEKAYCDEQMSKTEAKKSDLEDEEEKLVTKIDQATAKAADLKARGG